MYVPDAHVTACKEQAGPNPLLTLVKAAMALRAAGFGSKSKAAFEAWLTISACEVALNGVPLAFQGGLNRDPDAPIYPGSSPVPDALAPLTTGRTPAVTRIIDAAFGVLDAHGVNGAAIQELSDALDAEFPDDRDPESLVLATAVRVGDVLDLQGDPYAAGHMTDLDRHAAEFEGFTVVEATTDAREPGAAFLGFEGLFGLVCFPAGAKVARIAESPIRFDVVDGLGAAGDEWGVIDRKREEILDERFDTEAEAQTFADACEADPEPRGMEEG